MPGKLVPANQAHLGRRAELAGTGLPGPTDVHNRKNFWGINYCSTHKKASKNPQFVDMFFRGYFRCLLELCEASNIYGKHIVKLTRLLALTFSATAYLVFNIYKFCINTI